MNRALPIIRQVLRDLRTLGAGVLLFIVLPAMFLIMFGDR